MSSVKSKCSVLGKGIKNFNSEELPTILDVLRNILFVKKSLEKEPNSVFLAQKIVTESLIKHWRKLDSLTISTCRVNR